MNIDINKNVGKYGKLLSGGQRQIVYLLRCLFKNSQIVLLDEPTSSLDSKTKKYIHQAFLNGEKISKPFINHHQIMKGGTLELILDELPNKEWGKNAKVPEI